MDEIKEMEKRMKTMEERFTAKSIELSLLNLELEVKKTEMEIINTELWREKMSKLIDAQIDYYKMAKEKELPPATQAL
jgi:hypothetical protein